MLQASSRPPAARDVADQSQPRLYTAATSGSTAEVQALLSAGALVDEKDAQVGLLTGCPHAVLSWP